MPWRHDDDDMYDDLLTIGISLSGEPWLALIQN